MIPLSHTERLEQPNFIVIFVDDLGYGDLGCYGSPNIDTPRIYRLADEGILYANFYMGSSVCSASRASLLTGRYSALHGVKGVFFLGLGGMSPTEITIAEIGKGGNRWRRKVSGAHWIHRYHGSAKSCSRTDGSPGESL